MANMIPIQTVTVGSGGVSNISFTNIPQIYTDLILKISARTTGSSDDNMRITVNGDTAASYYNINLWSNGSSAATESVSGSGKLIADYAAGYLPNTSTTANTFNNFEMYIPNYTGSNYKSISINNVSENNSASTYIRTGIGSALWSNTSPITSLVVTNFNSFAQYSSATLYGIRKY